MAIGKSIRNIVMQKKMRERSAFMESLVSGAWLQPSSYHLEVRSQELSVGGWEP